MQDNVIIHQESFINNAQRYIKCHGTSSMTVIQKRCFLYCEQSETVLKETENPMHLIYQTARNAGHSFSDSGCLGGIETAFSNPPKGGDNVAVFRIEKTATTR